MIDVMSSDLPNGAAEDGGSAEERDPMAPPEEPCECFCLHCRRTFMSDRMWFQRVKNPKDSFKGFWMCPTANCSGAGFTFDIFPTDPNHPANEGWHSFDDDEEGAEEWEDDEEPEWLDEGEPPPDEWDPNEPAFKALDEELPDDDLEGEEWKYGLAPGETPQVEPPPPGVEPRNWMEEEALYDAPDQRPREIELPERPPREEEDSSSFNEDDIPF